MAWGWSWTTLFLLLAAGVAADALVGEPKRWHPLVGFGRMAAALEGIANRGRARTAKGLLAWCVAVGVPVALACAPAFSWFAWHVALLVFALGLRSLYDHTHPIAVALQAGDLPSARMLVSRIVTRDTAQADASEVAKATVESLLENGNDAVFGTLFWFAVAGGPGALLFRLANTLDAMWGYRTERFSAFGWAAARIDDALNWIPARLTALSYTLLGDAANAWRCWRAQASRWSSPNAGPVMAAGAGALGLELGGPARYDGVIELRPPLGAGRPAAATDVMRAWRLVAYTTLLWLATAGAAAFLERFAHA